MLGDGAAGYRLDVQGLRGVAVLLVVLFHAGLGFPGGFVGVDVFFAISGFVIGRTLIAEAERNGRISLANFYSRRVRRLLPALAAMLVVVSLVSMLVLAPAFPQPNALRTALAASFSVSNIFLWVEGGGYFTPVDEQNPFVHTWSLGVEEQFYLVFPLLVLVSWLIASRLRQQRQARGLVTFTSFVVAIGLASLACSIAWSYGATPFGDLVPESARFAFYGSISRMWEFLAGVLVAIGTGSRTVRRALGGLAGSVFGVVGLVLIVIASLAFSATTVFPGVAAALPIAGAVLVLASGVGPGARVLTNRTLVWLGDRSYSWYLWHWPAIVLLPIALPALPAAAPIAAAVSLIPSVLSYRYIEQRFRIRRGLPTRISAPQVAFVSIAMPVVVIGAGLVGAGRNWGLEPHPELAAPSVSQVHRCFEKWTTIEQCTFGNSGATGTVMLVGDSHADTISDAVIEAATADGYRVVVQTFLSCPFVIVDLGFESECTDRQRHILEVVEEVGPEVLVIANNSPLALSLIDGSSDGAGTQISEHALEVWEVALRETFAAVEPHVDRVLVFSTVPAFRADDFDKALPTLVRPTGGYPTQPVDDILEWRTPILEAESRAGGTSVPFISFLDVMPDLCSDECTVRTSDGSFRYRDPDHLSNPVARELTDSVRHTLGLATG